MIGGELAADAALAEGTPREGYELGWVADGLYGDASLPPAFLPPPVPSYPRRAPVHAETPVGAPAPGGPTPVRRRSPARRGRRELVLL